MGFESFSGESTIPLDLKTAIKEIVLSKDNPLLPVEKTENPDLAELSVQNEDLHHFSWNGVRNGTFAESLQSDLKLNLRGQETETQLKQKIVGLTRGKTGELLSGATPIELARTIHAQDVSLNTSFQVDLSIFGASKADILRQAFQIFIHDSLASEPSGKFSPANQVARRVLEELFPNEPDPAALVVDPAVLDKSGSAQKTYKPSMGVWSTPEIVPPSKSNEVEETVPQEDLQSEVELQVAYSEDFEKYLELFEAYLANYTQKHVGKPDKLKKADAGKYYKATSIPDGLVFATKNIDIVDPETAEVTQPRFLAGFVEVKSYTPQEFELFLKALRDSPETSAKVQIGDEQMTLGFQLDKNIEFLNTVTLFRNEKDRENFLRTKRPPYTKASTQILLRFPEDIPDEGLKELGQLLNQRGYKKVVIQKFPVTSSEIDEVGRQLLQAQLPQISKKLPFSNTQRAIIREIVNGSHEMQES